MAGVHNRKLFRQSSARDELRKLGGIMSSSEELMREAMNTAMQAPGPEARGPMAMPQRPPMGAGMPAPMPMMAPQGIAAQLPMQQPMMAPMPMQQPMMPMQQAMMAPQPMAQAPFMPPTIPQSVQPRGFDDGGLITLPPAPDRSGLGGVAKPRPMPRSSVPYVPDLTAEIDLNPAPPAVDITKEAGTVEAPRVEVDEDLVATAKDLEMRLEDEPPYAVANKILNEAKKKGVETTGNVRDDLAGIYESLTGDPAAYEKNIDQLNRGIIGAAIAAGTSARATENIAKGMLVGLEAAKDTEERRVRDARALQLAELQARTAEAKERSATESRAYRNPVDAYQDAYQAVMNAGEFDIEIPEGMSREEYADQVATDLVRRSYTPDQLVGSPFEGLPAPAATTAPAGGEGPTQTEEDILQSARAALQAGAPEAAVRERLEAMGIDPEKL